MSILITNDDGDSAGLRTLYEVAKSIDSKSFAIIPNRQRSAIGCAMTLHKPLRLHHIEEKIYSLSGTPSDCVLFGLYSKEFERPDFVMSGINWGDNTGLGSVLGSGTIAGCWQAALEGIPAIAFSLSVKNKEWRKKESWQDTQKLKAKVEQIVKIIKPKLKKYSFFNVNLPVNYENAEIVYTNKFQKKRYTTELLKRIDPDNVPYYWITGDAVPKEEEGADFNNLKKGKIVISEISLEMFNCEQK